MAKLSDAEANELILDYLKHAIPGTIDLFVEKYGHHYFNHESAAENITKNMFSYLGGMIIICEGADAYKSLTVEILRHHEAQRLEELN